MISKRWFVVAAGALALAACSGEQTKTEAPPEGAITDPAAVIRPIYDRYMTPEAQFPDFREHAPWSSSLWAVLEAMSQRSAQINEPILDFDPVIGGQDYQLTNLSVTTDGVVEASHAVVRASFNNAGTPLEILYDMVWEDGAWRVDNIPGDGWDLRQIAAAPGMQ